MDSDAVFIIIFFYFSLMVAYIFIVKTSQFTTKFIIVQIVTNCTQRLKPEFLLFTACVPIHVLSHSNF